VLERILVIFEDRPMLATSIETSHRDLFNGMAEPWATLKNDRNTYYLHFSFIPKTGVELPKTGVSLLR